jgi:multisubunit Na+/H+ antiporter MnhB subunit
MIFMSIVAIEAADLLSGLIALSAAGLGLTLAFLILKAPTLAITQLVVEILLAVILIRATISKDLPLVKDGRWFFNTAAAFLFAFIFLTFAFLALQELPLFGEPIMRLGELYIGAIRHEGKGNIVTEIALKYRLFDALVEAGIIFCAAICVLLFSQKREHVDETS